MWGQYTLVPGDRSAFRVELARPKILRRSARGENTLPRKSGESVFFLHNRVQQTDTITEEETGTGKWNIFHF